MQKNPYFWPFLTLFSKKNSQKYIFVKNPFGLLNPNTFVLTSAILNNFRLKMWSGLRKRPEKILSPHPLYLFLFLFLMASPRTTKYFLLPRTTHLINQA